MDEKTLQRLADREAIRDVLMRYSRGVDRHDLAALKSCYHEDSWDDHGHFKGNGQDFAEYILGSLAARTHHSTHSVLNHVIEFDDKLADRAYAETYGVAYLRRTDDKKAEWLDIFSGRYVDVFEKRAGEWRILSRTVVHDWSFSQPLDANSFPLQISNFIQGQRGASDLIYAYRAGKFPQPAPRKGR